jgi:hypothetical protein
MLQYVKPLILIGVFLGMFFYLRSVEVKQTPTQFTNKVNQTDKTSSLNITDSTKNVVASEKKLPY